MKKMLATVMIGAVLVGVAGCSWGRSKPSGSEQPSKQLVEGTETEQPQQADVKPLELPMYDVIDQKEMKVPTTKLGRELQVGPVKVKVELAGASYDRYVEGWALYQLHVIIRNNSDAPLDLNRRTAYWIASASALSAEYFDPRINWWTVHQPAPNSSNFLIIPDVPYLFRLKYPTFAIHAASWGKHEKGMMALPERVPAGQEVQGDIMFRTAIDMEDASEAEEHWYLFFGNSVHGEAWGRVDLGQIGELYHRVVSLVGPNPPEPDILKPSYSEEY